MGKKKKKDKLGDAVVDLIDAGWNLYKQVRKEQNNGKEKTEHEQEERGSSQEVPRGKEEAGR